MQQLYETYMHRCIQLARLGAGYTALNPMVGALLVFENRIIGEGWHQQYGEAHAEVNCIASVKKEDETLISKSTLYVSLEPCAHFGKTPPCVDLIIQSEIPKVVIGCCDPFSEVNGKGIEKLKTEGIEVIEGILEKECRQINQRFFHFHENKKPFIILKWAQSSNGKISGTGSERILISNEFTNQLVHKWRSEEAAILVGTKTALYDDPQLTNRLWNGPSPIRLVVDLNLRLPDSLKVFDGTQKTIVFNLHKQLNEGQIQFQKLDTAENLIEQIVESLYQLNIQSLLVEGGAILLQSFIDAGLWNEARVITNKDLLIPEGVTAPQLSSYKEVKEEHKLNDRIIYFKKHF